eukprot:4335041-Lingulodinium_polyedra.AAC.1
MSSCDTLMFPILGPMCLFPIALNDLHAVCNGSLIGVSSTTPGTRHITMSSLRLPLTLPVENV